MQYTLVRWVKGRPIQAAVLEAPEALKKRKEWMKLPGNLAFKPYRPEDEQIVAFAKQIATPLPPLQPRY